MTGFAITYVFCNKLMFIGKSTKYKKNARMSCSLWFTVIYNFVQVGTYRQVACLSFFPYNTISHSEIGIIVIARRGILQTYIYSILIREAINRTKPNKCPQTMQAAKLLVKSFMDRD